MPGSLPKPFLKQLARIVDAAKAAAKLGLRVAAGHGLLLNPGHEGLLAPWLDQPRPVQVLCASVGRTVTAEPRVP